MKPRIALIMKSLANEFFATMADGAKRYEREHAGTFELIVNGIKDERDLSRQVALYRRDDRSRGERDRDRAGRFQGARLSVQAGS